MKYAIDKIIGDIAVLENINTCEIKNVSINELPADIKETDILVFENDTYILDINEKENRVNMLREKMNKLRNSDSN